MSIQSEKLMNLADGKVLYDDLRDRIEEVAGDIPSVPVTDVKINGTSILSSGVANVPYGDKDNPGVVKVSTNSDSHGIGYYSDQNKMIVLKPALSAQIKAGNASSKPIVSATQHEAVFYGLSKLAGVDLASDTVTLGTYPDKSKSAIQHMLGVDGLIAPYESDLTADQAYAVGEFFINSGKLYKVTSAIAQGGVISPGTNCAESSVSDGFPRDVQVNGTSVVSNGVANVPTATDSVFGVVKPHSNSFSFYNGALRTKPAELSDLKAGDNSWKTVVPSGLGNGVFYGLAKASGDTTQASSSNAVGAYTAEAKASIQSMLGVETGVSLVETVSGTTPSITGQPNVRYMCGEVSTISITPPSSGTIDVVFTSGATPAVLTVVPPTGTTSKWPTWFDATSLDADTIYEIMITDGVYGAVMTWAN